MARSHLGNYFLSFWFMFGRVVPENPWTYYYFNPITLITLIYALAYIFALLTIIPFGKRLRLRADQIVASELGLGRELLRILKMIALSTTAPREWRLTSPKPPLLRRIQSLSDQLNVAAP